jgi:CDP-diacylglycerol pyrophosphatase
MQTAAAPRWATATLGVAALGAVALTSQGADRHALQEIVQEHCVTDWIARHDPAPCVQVVLPDPAHGDSGYAVLPDRKGGAHFLLIPIRSIPGIESPLLSAPGAPNYFAFAWEARARLTDVVGQAVPRSAVGLAVNPPKARSQDQLHIHVECLSTEVVRTIDDASPRLGPAWMTVRIGGARFEARRLMGETLGDRNPFEILARDIPDSNRIPADYTLLVAGSEFPEGPGFVLLAGTERAAELLLDSSCAAAGGRE